MIFEIQGEPMGKQRPKFSRAGKFVRTYTPAKTVNYEQWVKLCYKQAGGEHLGTGPIEIVVEVNYKIPKSFSKKKRQQALDRIIVPTVKPDCDNVLKIICDSLNGIAYEDDKQIVHANVWKFYAEQPSVNVRVNTINDTEIGT